MASRRLNVGSFWGLRLILTNTHFEAVIPLLLPVQQGLPCYRLTSLHWMIRNTNDVLTGQ